MCLLNMITVYDTKSKHFGHFEIIKKNKLCRVCKNKLAIVYRKVNYGQTYSEKTTV